MNKEERERQIRSIFDAMKSNVSGSWLNHGSLLIRPERGKTPFEGILKAAGLDNGDHKGWHTPQEKEWTEFATRLDSFAANVGRYLAPVQHSGDGADYDDARGVILLPERGEYDRVLEYAHDLFTAASIATGTPDRLNRPGVVLSQAGAGEHDAIREQLVGELVTAAMCIEEGKAASLAPSSVDTVEEWEKYIADNPEHFDGIIEDVNRAVYALREIKRGRKPDFEKIAGEVQKKSEENVRKEAARLEAEKKETEKQQKLKSQTEQKAAERQVALLTAALLRAGSGDGVWMNPDGKLYPGFYPKGPAISPFNAISLTLHADENAYRTNLYTTFQEARVRNEGVRASEKGVPFNWYNWSQYVNRNKPDDVISRKAYLSLSGEEKLQYKGVHNREIRTLFNIDQTMTPVIDPDGYGKAVGWNGGVSERRPSESEDKIRREVFGSLLDSVSKNLVTVETESGQPVAMYDARQDVVRVPSRGAYVNFHDYVHDTICEIMRATGHPERLAREGAVSRASRDDAVREELIVELATGVKMLELGMPARLSSGSYGLVDDWVGQLREDPQIIDVVETEVNNALEVVNKAERGEKVEYSSYVNQQKVIQLQEKQKPQVSSAEALVLADIIRHHGMALRDENFSSPEEKSRFIEKFSLGYYFEQIDSAAASARSGDPDVVEAAYDDIYNHAAHVDRIARELRPADWNIKGRREVEELIHELMDTEGCREMVIIMDEKTRKADIILPQGAFEGGKVTLPGGQVRNFYVSPDEVLCAEEKKGARVQYNDASGFSKVRIDHALANHKDFEPSFTRYFNRDGVVGFHADDRYFEGKRLFVASLNQWSLGDVRSVDISDMVERSRHPNFEKVMMLKDDDGWWMLFIQAQDEKPFGIYPDKADVNRFFTAAHQGNAAISSAVRQELAVKYYELAKVKPGLQVNVLGEKASEEDASRLQRVNIFKNKQGQFMIVAKVTDTPRDMPPRPITSSQWQRLWLSPDHEEYKRDLAARIFADILHPELSHEAEKGMKLPAEENSVEEEQEHVSHGFRR